MLRGYQLLEVRPAADGFDVRFPFARYEHSEEEYEALRGDIHRFAAVADGVVRIDLTALEWVTAATAGQLVTLWRATRGRIRVVLVVSGPAADFFRITRLVRLFETWELDPARVLARV